MPVGRLNRVQKDWDCQSGWVKAPLREIVFNDRLTKQARLVWLWLASVPPNSRRISWGECETMLRCGTKARRSCMYQLVTEGYISVEKDGTVVMNDPYQIYNKKRKEVLEEIREEWIDSIEEFTGNQEIAETYEIISLEKSIDKQIKPAKQEENSQSQKTTRSSNKDINPVVIMQAWNKCKPESYSTLRTLSIKQKECIIKHMKNLGLPLADCENFICSVCLGLSKSHFWSKQIDQKGRNFNSVFGYGNPQDVKMRNIETLYTAGSEHEPESSYQEKKQYTIDQQDTIDAYRFVSLNLEQSKSRGDTPEIERWSKIMEDTLQEIAKYQINLEEI